MAGGWSAKGGSLPLAPYTPGTTGAQVWFDSTRRLWRSIDDQSVVTDLFGGSSAQSNLISNSSQRIWQRQTPGSYANTISSATARTYGLADRWAGTTQNGTVGGRRIDTQASIETGLNSRYYSDLIKNTTGKLIISTGLPAQLSFPLRSQTVYFGFKCKLGAGTDWTNLRFGLASYSGTADSTVVTFLSGFGASTADATLAANYAYAPPLVVISGTSFDSQGVSATISSTWTRYGALFTVPSTCRNLVAMVWSRDQVVGNSVLFFAEPVLTAGPTAVDWAPPNETAEYADCARFFQKTSAIDVAPAQNLGVNTGEFRFLAGLAGALGERSNTYVWPFRLRATPTTTTTYNPAATNAQVRDVTAAADCTATAVAGSVDSGLYVTATGAAGTLAGDHLGIHLSADAEIL